MLPELLQQRENLTLAEMAEAERRLAIEAINQKIEKLGVSIARSARSPSETWPPAVAPSGGITTILFNDVYLFEGLALGRRFWGHYTFIVLPLLILFLSILWISVNSGVAEFTWTLLAKR